MKLNQLPSVTVDGPNGSQQAVNLLPSFKGTAALVSLDVIKRLAALLPKAKISDIKQELFEKLNEVDNIEEYVAILSSEVEFHQSVNLLQEIEVEEKERV